MTPRELANKVGIKPQVIYNYIREKRIQATLINGKLWIPQEEVDKYLARREARAQAQQDKIERELNQDA